ncbi:hypothetical protein QTP86_027394, partial [Hemibagrus guttatus]
ALPLCACAALPARQVSVKMAAAAAEQRSAESESVRKVVSVDHRHHLHQ